MTQKEGHVYAIANRKGGVGKTTTAVALAHGLARKIENENGRVIIVDFDPQGNVATSLQLTPQQHDLADLLLEKCTFKECVLSANRAEQGLSRPNLFIIPASDSLAQAKGELMIKAVIGGRKAVAIEDILVAKLGFLRQLFDYIIVDCPPTLDVFADSIYKFADEAIVPVKTDFLGEVGAAHHTANILETQAYGIDIKIAYILPTFYDARLTIARSVLDNLIRHYGKDVVATPIPRSTIFEQAPAVDGQTIFEYRQDSQPASAYQELVDRVYARR